MHGIWFLIVLFIGPQHYSSNQYKLGKIIYMWIITCIEKLFCTIYIVGCGNSNYLRT